MAATSLRQTGISVVGEMPWGTHFCHFYETTSDLLNILLPYFKAGLVNNEFCLWVVSAPLDVETATNSLRQYIPDADRHLAAGDIEIVSHVEWYHEDGVFDMQRVISGWLGKLAQALAEGHTGMRANGTEAWLTAADWKNFAAYEKRLGQLITGQRILMLCTYPLGVARAVEISDVARTHQFAVTRSNGNWNLVETPALKQAKHEIKRLHDDLEQRVAERTAELAVSNEELRREIGERKRAEEKLKQSESLLAEAQRLAHIGSWNWDTRSNIITASEELYRIYGLPAQETDTLEAFFVHVLPEDRDFVRATLAIHLQRPGPFTYYHRIIRTDGKLRTLYVQGNMVSDEQGQAWRMLGTAQDVTERRQAEARLQDSNEKLRALSASLQSAREAEGTRIAREIHDELGSALTGLRWELERVNGLLAGSGNEAQGQALREKIRGMIGLTETTITTVRRIASELRPSVLDDLGLVEAIEWQAQQFQHRTGITYRFDCAHPEAALSHEQSTALFRIFQETLTNILRHAQATRVNIAFKQEAGEFVLLVSDNGRGITEAEKSGSQSLGLLGMRERAHLVGGRLDITGTQAAGTSVTVRVPASGPASD